MDLWVGRSSCPCVWVVGTVRGSSYHSGRVSVAGGSAGPQRHTCRGGSRGRSRLRAPARRIRCGDAGPASVRGRARPRPRLARPRRPLRPLRPAQPVTCSTLRLPVPLVVLAVAAGEVSGAHAEAAQYAGAAVPAAARPRGRTCGGGLGVSAARGPLHLRSPRRAE